MSERVLLPLLTATLLLGLWHGAVVLSGTEIFPSPLAVASALLWLAGDGLLWSYAGDSVGRVCTGYALGVAAGIPIGLWLGWFPLWGRAVNPLIQMFRPISPLAWMPLAVIWFGVDNAAPIFLIFLASLFPVVVATMHGVRNVPSMQIQAARNFGLSTAQMMRRVILPSMMPRLLTALRITFGIAWLVLVAAEMIAVDSGLGYLIIDARNAGKRYDLVVAGMLMIGLIGVLADALFRGVERMRMLRD